MAEDENLDLKGFGSKAVHSGTNHIGDAVNTPIFQSSTYKLTISQDKLHFPAPEKNIPPSNAAFC